MKWPEKWSPAVISRKLLDGRQRVYHVNSVKGFLTVERKLSSQVRIRTCGRQRVYHVNSVKGFLTVERKLSSQVRIRTWIANHRVRIWGFGRCVDLGRDFESSWRDVRRGRRTSLSFFINAIADSSHQRGGGAE
ncbi:hypothetical protein QE152_g29105 [Popillia japonica]|uniref:NUMOD4 domain-containing protein n=1 Tax=Popillia japonica TaxID=7064 RepID=A0AAW1JIU6_POPJA